MVLLFVKVVLHSPVAVLIEVIDVQFVIIVNFEIDVAVVHLSVVVVEVSQGHFETVVTGRQEPKDAMKVSLGPRYGRMLGEKLPHLVILGMNSTRQFCCVPFSGIEEFRRITLLGEMNSRFDSSQTSPVGFSVNRTPETSLILIDPSEEIFLKHMESYRAT